MADDPLPPAAPAPGVASRRAATRRAGALLALLAAAAAAYLPAVDGDFVYDDVPELQGPMVQAPFEQGWRTWLGADRPLVTLTYALNDLAVGGDPRGWHLTSIALHLAAVLLAFAVAARLLARAGLAGPAGPALAAAALFALHPLQVESVAYLSQRAEVLAAGLLLLGLGLLLLRDEAGTPGRRRALLLGALAAQGLGALAKPTVAVLPAAWLLAAALLPPPGEAGATALGRVRARLLAAAPLFAVSAAMALRALGGARGSGHAGLEVEGLPPLAYLATQCRVVPTYLRLLLWPAGQSVDWDVPRSAGLLEPAALAGAAFLLALTLGAALVAARARGRAGDGPAAARAAAFGLLFFLLLLAPSSSLVPLADVLAEHRVYLALLGPAIAVAAAGAWAARRAGATGRTVAWVAAVAACALLAALTVRRAAVWASDEALWRDAAARAPGKARPHLNLGVALLARGRFEEALAALGRAQALAADRTVPPDILLTDVVDALAALGRLDEARAEVEAALAQDPRSRAALGLLVRVVFGARRVAEAEAAARAALEVDPGNPMARKFLGTLLGRRGELDEAAALLRGAAADLPRDGALLLELGQVEAGRGDLPAACEALRRAAEAPGPAALAARAAAAWHGLGCGG